MFNKTDNAPVVASDNRITKDSAADNSIDKAELRRQMYERIAQGNQMAEVDALAQSKWHKH